MPSPRRVRLLILAAAATTLVFFFYASSSGAGSGTEAKLQDFYHKTMDAMDRGDQSAMDASKAPVNLADKDGDGDVDADDQVALVAMVERLKAAEVKAKEKANEKALRPDPPSNIVGIGSSAEGQGKEAVGASDSKTPGDSKERPKDSKEVSEVKDEINSILKRSPVIIFSKSYCPYSKRAKALLLEKYVIKPDPYVVELDEHKLGSALQDQLLERTGRRTVPNILINGISIGGADDILDLDKADKLVAKILELGGKRIEMTDRSVAGGSKS